MNMDSSRRATLIRQIKQGRQFGATQSARLFVIVVGAITMFGASEVVFRQGKGSLGFLTSVIGMVFVTAVAGIGLGQLEMNERFAALLELIGEDRNAREGHGA